MNKDSISLPMISTKAIGSTRQLPTFQSIPTFRKIPFGNTPPTQLPIAFLFWFHILLLIMLALVAVFTRSVNLKDYNYYYYTDVYYFFIQEMTWKEFWKICIFIIFGDCSSFFFLLFWGLGIWTIPLITIYISIIFCYLLLIGVIIFAFLYGNYFIGSLGILLVLYVTIGCVYHRNHIVLTSKLYSIIIPICRNISVSIWFIMLFVYSVVYLIWVTIIAITLLCIQQFAVISDFLGLLSIIYILFSWYWSTKVIKNIGGVFAGSVVGKWYFYQSSAQEGIKSGKNTVICSLGSICFGSLVISPVSKLVFFSRKDAPGIYSQCNPYAFSHICIYGTTLLDASSDALRIFKVNGIKSLLDDTAVGAVGTLAAIATGTIGSLVGGALGIYFSDYGGTLIVIGFLTGYGLGDVIIEILDASVLLLLMCICEDTSCFSARAPLLESFLKEKYSTECSSLFSARYSEENIE